MNNRGGHLHMSWCCNWEGMDDQWHRAMNSSLVLPQRTIVCLSDSQEKRTNPANVTTRHTSITGGIMAWEPIAFDFSSPLAVIWMEDSDFTAMCQWNPMSGWLTTSSNTTLLQSFSKKTPGHMRHVKLFCQVKVLLWSASSPDLSSVTHQVPMCPHPADMGPEVWLCCQVH